MLIIYLCKSDKPPVRYGILVRFGKESKLLNTRVFQGRREAKYGYVP